MSGKKGKILLYYHHFGGLGHGTRMAAICKELKALGSCEMVVINSGKPQPELGIQKYARLVNLPSFEAASGLFAGLKATEGALQALRKRRDILNEIRLIFKPDVAVFEHYPFGRGALKKEIAAYIAVLSAGGCKVYSSVRDIIDQSLDVEELQEQLKHFHGVLVHADKEMGFMTSFVPPVGLSDKMFFTGRVASFERADLRDIQQVREEFVVMDKKWIVISVGGGIDGEGLLARLVRLKNMLDQAVVCSFLIATGPNMRLDHYEALRKSIGDRKDIVLTRFMEGFPDCVNAADLSISMGGYNSVNNALLTGTRTLIFARRTDKEQTSRGQVFKEYVQLVDESISDEDLIQMMRTAMEQGKIAYSKSMPGARVTARLLDIACHIQYIKVRLTSKCNLSCDMCSWERKQKVVSLAPDVLKRLILRARVIGVRIFNVTGGEPTLLPEIRDILQQIHANGFRVSLSTNGFVAASRLATLIPFIHDSDISLDSHSGAIHDHIRGKVGAFEKTLKSIALLSAHNIKPHISVTIRPDNFKDLHRMIPLLAGKIRSISFNMVDMGEMDTTDKFVFTEKQLAYFFVDEAALIIAEAVKNKVKVKITPFFPEFADMGKVQILKELYLHKEELRARIKSVFRPTLTDCLIPKQYVRVNPTGDIAFCCFQDEDGNPWGNVLQEDICDIVVSDKYYNFVDNAVEGKGACLGCKRNYNENYGGT